MQKGQTSATAPSIIGDWVGFQLNGIGSETIASSIVVANQKDAKKMKIVFPFGEIKKGEWSFAPPKAGADPENSMIYSADVGMRKVAGIKIDQATGELKVVFVVDDASTTFQPLIGPPDKRVLLLTNMKQNVDEGAGQGRAVHRQLQGAADLARRRYRQDHRRVGLLRAAVDQRPDPAGLRRPHLLPDRGRQGLLRAAGDAEAGVTAVVTVFAIHIPSTGGRR